MKIRPYRFGPNSDVCVYENANGDLLCHFCNLTEENFFNARDVGEMIAHITEHSDSGDKVPEGLLDDLKGLVDDLKGLVDDK